MHISKPRPPIYGIMAEFRTPEAAIAAARRAYGEGYRKLDAFSPYPIEELSEAIGFHHTRLPMIVLIGGIVGCVGGFMLQYWGSTTYYALNIGGRPLNSWPAFVPITFECTVLVAAFTTVLGMLALNGLPQPYHPVFNVPEFVFASRDKFFVAIEATDPLFGRESTRKFLESLQPDGVFEIDH